jgi:tetratricopeptide (TPR) repeat protein
MQNFQNSRVGLLKAIQKKNYREALEYYNEAVQQNFEDPSLRLVGADIYLNLGMKQLAVGELRQAMNLYLDQGKKAQAITCAEKIRVQTPDDLEILEILAQLHKDINNEEKAAYYYGELINELIKRGEINNARKILQRVRNAGLERYILGKYQFLLTDSQVQALMAEISKEPNYPAFFALLRKEIARSERYQREFSINLIEFDKVLVQDKKMQLLEIFKRSLRESDMYSVGYRWIFVILPETNKYGLESVVNRLKERLGNTFGNKKIYISNYPEDGKDVKELIISALKYRVYI